MLVDGVHHRTIWSEEPGVVTVIDQRHLPFEFRLLEIRTAAEMAEAIRSMAVRGAGLIGAAAAHGMALAAHAAQEVGDPAAVLDQAGRELLASRPTAVNLEWAVGRMDEALAGRTGADLAAAGAREAQRIADEDAAMCEAIGRHGAELLVEIHERTSEPVQVLTHCNAGWLAFVDHGTATAPVYAAHDRGVPVHVWVDETRPRNQGARLTAWELGQHGVPHTVIVDNVGGHLMQHGMVDLVLTGSDRTTHTGDVANKIGTYLKALAARDNDVPFYAALPSSTIDWSCDDGVAGTPIEMRDPDEVIHVEGAQHDGIGAVRVVAPGSPAVNYGFDVTPARLVTGLITERGVTAASREGIADLFPEHTATGRRECT